MAQNEQPTDNRTALRQQHGAPDLANVTPEVLAYIERLEQALIDVCQARDRLYAAMWLDTKD